MEDNILDKARNIWVPRHALWIMQRAGSIPAMDQWGPYRIHWYLLHCLLGWCTHILGYPVRTPARRQEDSRSNTEIGHEDQTFKIRILQKGNRIPWIHHQQRRHQSRPSQDTGNMGLDDHKDDKGNTVFPTILQLVLKLHRRIQQNSETPLWSYSEKVWWQMGMEGKGTTSVRRTQKETQNNTGHGRLQARSANQTRDSVIEIGPFRNLITTMWGQEMQTSGLLIQDKAGCWMQLLYARQRTISDNPDVQRMETIPWRKSETRTGPHGPQELSYFHDNKETKRRTSRMEDTPQSIQLRNWVPTREGRRVLRTEHLKGWESQVTLP